jgi:xylulose-5-phosphate/fructose-6-phosphate phosphoketolase
MTTTVSRPPAPELSPEELRAIDAWWRAANYLAVGQIYLKDNPLLRSPSAPST